MNQSLTPELDRVELGQSWCHAIQTLLHLEAATLFLPDAQGDLVAIATAPVSAVAPSGLCAQIHHASPLYAYVRQAAWCVDGQTLLRAIPLLALAPAERQLLVGCEHWLWLPIAAQEELLGMLRLEPKPSQTSFDAHDREVLQSFTRQTGILLQQIQVITALQRRNAECDQVYQFVFQTCEVERKTLARDLHDQIIQEIVGINYDLADLRQRVEPVVTQRIELLQTHIRGLLDDVRRICRRLRPPALDSLGLVAALRSYLRETVVPGAVQVTLKVAGDAERRLPEDIEMCLFRVVQEALANVQHHAAATLAEVLLDIGQEEVRLQVQDNGVGFDVPSPLSSLLREKRLGLVGLCERVNVINGTMTIASALGQGTSIHVQVPLPTPMDVINAEEEG